MKLKTTLFLQMVWEIGKNKSDNWITKISTIDGKNKEVDGPFLLVFVS